MAGTGDEDEDKGEGRPRGDDGDGAECSFVWDDQSQLYYHARRVELRHQHIFCFFCSDVIRVSVEPSSGGDLGMGRALMEPSPAVLSVIIHLQRFAATSVSIR